MGYTHYIYESKKPTEIPEIAVKALERLLSEGYEKGIIQREYDNSDKPLVNKNKVVFNGVGDDGCETFYYSTDDEYKSSDNEYFSFCKTRGNPYDEYVMKAYLILSHYIPSIRVKSDGSFSVEWADAIKWAEKELSTKINLGE